jgi:hypothetical protein
MVAAGLLVLNRKKKSSFKGRHGGGCGRFLKLLNQDEKYHDLGDNMVGAVVVSRVIDLR